MILTYLIVFTWILEVLAPSERRLAILSATWNDGVTSVEATSSVSATGLVSKEVTSNRTVVWVT